MIPTTILISLILQISNANLNWIKSTTDGNDRAFIGYDEVHDLIKIFGGFTASASNIDLVEYRPQTQSTNTTNIGHNYGYNRVQGYTQDGQALYMLPYSSSSLNLFNLTTNSFTSSITKYHGSATYGRCITFYGGYLVAGGGRDGGGGGSFYKDVLFYDILNNEWNTGKKLSSGRGDAACNAVNDKYYFIGGYTYDEGYTDEILTMSMSNLISNTGSWSSSMTLNEPKAYHRTAVYKNNIYVVGGYGLDGGYSGALETVEIIDTTTNTITPTTSLKFATYYHQVIIVEDIIFSFGGYETDSKYQYAVIPTYSPTASPSNAPSADSSDPSNSPSSSPSFDPTDSPSSSPTRYPTKKDEYNQQVAVIYTIYKLLEDNVKELDVNTVNIDIIPFVETAYVQTAPYYADANDDDDLLEYRDFEIVVENDEKIKVNNSMYTLSMRSTLYYKEDSVRINIEFMSYKNGFIKAAQKTLRNYFDNQNAEFQVEFIEATATSSKAFNYFITALSLFLGAAFCGSLAAFYFNKRVTTKIDDANWLSIFFYALQVFDFVTDINLAIEILSETGKTAILLLAGYGSIIFLVVPYIINVIIAINIDRFIADNQFAAIYFKQKRTLFLFFVAWTGSIHSTLSLLSSRVFALKSFYSGLTSYEIQQMSAMKFYGGVLLENIPQLICQILYALHSGHPSQSTILSFISSFLSIFVAILSYFMEYRTSNCIAVKYDLKCIIKNINGAISKKDEKLISQQKECKNAMTKELCTALDVAESMIEIGYIHEVNNGFVMHLVHFLFQNQLNSLMEKHHAYNYPKQFISKLYATKKQEVNIAFMNHFGFEEEFTVQYYHQIGYQQLLGQNVIELKQNEKNQSKILLLKDVTILFEQNESFENIKKQLIQQRHQEEDIQYVLGLFQDENDEKVSLEEVGKNKKKKEQTKVDTSYHLLMDIKNIKSK